MSESSGKPSNVNPGDLAEILLDALSPVEPAPESAQRMRERLMARVATNRAEGTAKLVTVAASSGDWFEPVPGNEIKLLRSDDDTESILVRLAPGATFPSHSHPADEETYVIEGETWFGDIHLVAGDYHLAPKGTVHGEVRTDTGCVLFIRKGSDDR